MSSAMPPGIIEVNGVPVVVNYKDKDFGAGETFHRLNSHRRREGEPLAVLNSKELQGLRIQQKLALKYYFSGMSKKKSEKLAGYKSPGAIDRALTTVAGNEMMKQAMEKHGLTAEKLMEVLAEGLDAKHPFKPKQKDFHAIDKFLDKAIKIQDGYPATKMKTESDHRHVHIHLTRDDDQQAAKFAKMRGIAIEAEAIQEP